MALNNPHKVIHREKGSFPVTPPVWTGPLTNSVPTLWRKSYHGGQARCHITCLIGHAKKYREINCRKATGRRKGGPIRKKTFVVENTSTTLTTAITTTSEVMSHGPQTASTQENGSTSSKRPSLSSGAFLVKECLNLSICLHHQVADELSCHVPFAGKQRILVGGVSAKATCPKHIWRGQYYVFMSVYAAPIPHGFELTQVMRQSNAKFLLALSDLRMGKCWQAL